MIKRALVIAPHPDDEINLAGQLIIKMNKFGIEIYVVYTTNGDVESKIGNKRIVEAIGANDVLGIREDHVIFLGYPNEWQGDTHIYNAIKNEELISRLGKKETNSIATHPEFCFTLLGVHHKFTRENFKSDLKNIIKYLKADLLIAPEFDSHSDHRAASLMFDEIMGEIIKEDFNYRPLILKKYIHEGVWYGPKDYYQMLPTMTDGPREYAGGIHDLDSPCFKWDERIIIPSDKETLTPLLKDNIIYKAAKKHKVTTAWYEMQRVINSDIVYWVRRTDNLSLHAKIEVSSGECKYLNDFKLYDCDDVLEKKPFKGVTIACWRPNDDDSLKKITFNFENKEKVKNIIIYKGFACRQIKKISILDDDKLFMIVEPNNTCDKCEISLNETMLTKKLIIQILEWQGDLEISEIELYSSKEEQIIDILSEKRSIHRNNKKLNCWIMQKIEYISFVIKFLFEFKIQYEVKRLMNVVEN